MMPKSKRYSTIGALRGAAGSLSDPLPWNELRQIAREDALTAKVTKLLNRR
jgi:hypothetical protein